MIGSVINQRYRLDGMLGQGGMGLVYRAHDTLLGRDVAVKLLNESGLGSEGRARLLNEARAAAQLNHPNIVAVFDAGELEQAEHRAPYIVMELVDGQSLDENRPLALDELYRVAYQICAALDAAHLQGIIHRDLKPENVLLTRSGTAKLTDFGLARSLASRMTTEGTIVGTVFYMAPEMLLNQPMDGRADLYALGVMLYELVAGRLPFVADNPLGIISQHIHAPVVPPGAYQPDLPAALEAIIVKLLAKDPNERYPDARSVQQALSNAQQIGWTAEVAGDRVADNVDDLLEKLARGRLVGRRSEMDALHRLWKNALAGAAQLALISGEPGIGKTRLAHELMVYARLSGATVLRGGCYEYEAATPYLPFVEALREWVRRQNDASLSAALSPLAAELAKLAPEIETRLGPLPANPTLAPNEERLRLFDHVARLLERLGHDNGLLLFIDDIHWADQGSLALLNYLMRHLRDTRLMVLACYREVELDRAHPLAAALVDWGRERLATRLSLARLAAASVSDLLAALFGMESMSDEFSQAIFRETEGNPFFVEEVIKTLIETGQIYRQAGRWQRQPVADLALPQSIKEAIGRRLNRQSPDSIQALHAAAALGKRFTFIELAAVAQLSENTLLDALDEAESAQLIRSEAAESYAFTHDKIREVLYEELNPIRRRRLHLRLGEGLEHLYAPQSGGRNCAACDREVQSLAHHFIEGGDLEKGMDYAMQAGKKAQAVFALEDALLYYARALDCAEGLALPAQVAELHEQMAFLHFQHGDYQAAAAAFEQALALAADAPNRARLKTHLGTTYAQMGDERVHSTMQAVIAELDGQSQAALLGLAYAQLGRYYHYHGQLEQAIDTLHQARQILEPLADVEALTNVYSYLAGAYQFIGDFETSMAWAHRCIELGEQCNYPAAVALGYEFLAEDTYVLGQWRQALVYAHQGRAVGRRIGSQSRLAWSYSAEGHSLLGLGDLQGALTAANEALALVERTGELRLGLLLRSLRTRLYAEMGKFDMAQADLDILLRHAAASSQAQVWSWTFGAALAVHALQAQWAEVLALSARCEQLLGYRIGLAEALAAIGLDQRATAQQWYTAFQQELAEAQNKTENRQGEVHLTLGLLEGYLGRAAAAETHFDQALDIFQATESRLEQGRTLYHRSQLHTFAGRSQQAAQDAEQARTILSACGAHGAYFQL